MRFSRLMHMYQRMRMHLVRMNFEQWKKVARAMTDEESHANKIYSRATNAD